MLILTALVMFSRVPLIGSCFSGTHQFATKYTSMLIHVHCPSQHLRVVARLWSQAYHEHCVELLLLQGHCVAATPMLDPENNCYRLGGAEGLVRVRGCLGYSMRLTDHGDGDEEIIETKFLHNDSTCDEAICVSLRTVQQQRVKTRTEGPRTGRQWHTASCSPC